MALFHGTAQYGSVRLTFGWFSTGHSTWYIFSTNFVAKFSNFSDFPSKVFFHLATNLAIFFKMYLATFSNFW